MPVFHHALQEQRSIDCIRTAGKMQLYPDAFMSEIELALSRMPAESDDGI